MDADLARAARGQAVAPETEEAATQVLARRGNATIATAPTEIVRRPVNVAPPPPAAYGPPTGYYEYDEPIAPALVLALAARARCSSPRRDRAAGTSTRRSRTS